MFREKNVISANPTLASKRRRCFTKKAGHRYKKKDYYYQETNFFTAWKTHEYDPVYSRIWSSYAYTWKCLNAVKYGAVFWYFSHCFWSPPLLISIIYNILSVEHSHHTLPKVIVCFFLVLPFLIIFLLSENRCFHVELTKSLNCTSGN